MEANRRLVAGEDRAEQHSRDFNAELLVIELHFASLAKLPSGLSIQWTGTVIGRVSP